MRWSHKAKNREQRKLGKKTEEKELAELDVKCQNLGEACRSGTVSEPPRLFVDLPLSQRTQAGLKEANFTRTTDIQRTALPLALAGRDVLGAARTGSGKTLAFVVPVVERLLRLKWGPQDGVGAIIISPTRELAHQIFDVLRKVGKHHDLSAGLLIGGKKVEEEQSRISRMNILVCTPGRLLQHMDETPEFTCDGLQILVLDEADRILDLGFERTLTAIVEFLPTERQTMLFSATQTKSVHDLARLSLQEPDYVGVHDGTAHCTPSKLLQSYAVVPLPSKVDTLWSFIKSHEKCKILVFVSSCKQVRFLYEALRRLKPNTPLLSLHGKQKQARRMGVYKDFCGKQAAVLFATDIAARGLDIPAVHWVVQLDCPEDANTYIHRVGRTARYSKNGKAFLMLLPSEEEGMLAALSEKKVPLTKIQVNPVRTQSVKSMLAGFCAENADIKYLCQKSFISYMRSVYLQPKKNIFDIQALPAEEYAQSLGLPGAPRIRFLRGKKKPGAVNGHSSSTVKDGEFNYDDNQSVQSNEYVDDDEEQEEEDVIEEEDIGRATAIKKNVISKRSTANDDSHSDDDEEESDDDSEVDSDDSDDDEQGPVSDAAAAMAKPTRMQKMFQRKNAGTLSAAYAKLRAQDDVVDDDDIFMVKRDRQAHDNMEVDEECVRDLDHLGRARRKEKIITKATIAKTLLKKGIVANRKVVYDEDGEIAQTYGVPPELTSEGDKTDGDTLVGLTSDTVSDSEVGGIDVDEVAEKLRKADKADRIRERDRIRAKHKEEKLKRRERERGHRDDEDDDDDAGVTLSVPNEYELSEKHISYDSSSEDEEDSSSPQRKRAASTSSSGELELPKSQVKRPRKIADDEALAMALLNEGSGNTF